MNRASIRRPATPRRNHCVTDQPKANDDINCSGRCGWWRQMLQTGGYPHHRQMRLSVLLQWWWGWPKATTTANEENSIFRGPTPHRKVPIGTIDHALLSRSLIISVPSNQRGFHRDTGLQSFSVWFWGRSTIGQDWIKCTLLHLHHRILWFFFLVIILILI